MTFLKQVNAWEIIVFLICALFLSNYACNRFDLINRLRPTAAEPVHMGGNVGNEKNLRQVQVVNIPDYVYDSLEVDTRFKLYLTGNHKYIFLFTYPGCPYARAYSGALQHAFENEGFSSYYRKRIFNVGRSSLVSCPGRMNTTCATMWLYQTCFGNLCVFNPVRKQVVVDKSQQATQLGALLDIYKEW